MDIDHFKIIIIMVTLVNGDVDTSGRLRILKLVDARYETFMIKGE
jgi:hypothetical protein